MVPHRWRVSLHGVTAEVTAPGVPFADLMPLPFAAYATADGADPPDFSIVVEPEEGVDVWSVAAGQFRFRDIEGAEMAARRTEWAFADGALRRLEGFVHVHAAVVGTAARSLLIVGESGRGKSTTSVGLAHRGLLLYTDDVALIEPASRRPVSFPRPIKLDDASRALLLGLGLRIPAAARLRESVARTALPGLPPLDAPGPPLAAAVFFAGNRLARPALRPITAAEGVLRVVQQSSTERVAAGGPTPGVVTLINSVRCYELTAGDFPETVRLLADLVRSD